MGTTLKSYLATLVLAGTIFATARAQQDAQYTQYMYNTLSINPAYAGSRGVLSVAALYRTQWIGLDGAPETQTLNISAPLSERTGVGLSVINDAIGEGTSQETHVDATFSYTVPVSSTGRLSFGAKAGGHLLNVDFTRLEGYINDPTANGGLVNIDQKFSPNFGAGIYYYSQNYYVGLSVPNFLETEHFDGSGDSGNFLARERMNWYLISGYVFELNDRILLKPALLGKVVNGAPLQLDLSLSAMVNRELTLGLAYRWDAALSAMFAFRATDGITLGIAYDRETTALGNAVFNDGSFEVFLRYDIINKNRKILTPRFF